MSTWTSHETLPTVIDTSAPKTNHQGSGAGGLCHRRMGWKLVAGCSLAARMWVPRARAAAWLVQKMAAGYELDAKLGAGLWMIDHHLDGTPRG